MKAFNVKWHAQGMNGSYSYIVVEETLEKAKELWNEFVAKAENTRINYTWERAKKGMKNHYGGYIKWKEIGETDKERGCYEDEYDKWNSGSDHLRD